MGTKSEDSCRENSADDEPIFTLCARDINGPDTVRDWIRRSRESGVHPDKLADAAEVADAMEAWQKANPGKVKKPD